MSSLNFQVYDVFTDVEFGGNVAGVITRAGEISEPKMQLIAREIGVPATGFVSQDSDNSFSIRFFTPTQEIGMCGHGLVGACVQLISEGQIVTDTITMNTNSGTVAIKLDRNATPPRVMLEQSPPRFQPYPASNQALIEALGIQSEELINNYPIEKASGALEHLIVPVRDLKTLQDMSPNFTKLTELSHEGSVISIDVFCLETINSKAFVHSRDFCPAAGIPEAAGSGTTNAALFCYLIRHNILSPTQGEMTKIQAEQGYEMNRPSQIECQATLHNDEIHELMVGGTAVMSIEGQIRLPN